MSNNPVNNNNNKMTMGIGNNQYYPGLNNMNNMGIPNINNMNMMNPYMNHYNQPMMQQPYNIMNYGYINPNMNMMNNAMQYMMANPTLNNYNRGGNMGMNNNNYGPTFPTIPINYNSVPVNNQPIKIIQNPLYNNNITNITNNTSKIDKDRAQQRSMSSKNRNSEKSLSGLDNSYLNNDSGIGSSSKRRGISSNTNFEDGIYKPYTLQDYKKLTSAKIVLGSLGPNIGTKEWEEKAEKLKKMEDYAKNLKTGKIAIKLKADTPQENIEKEKREKIERSNRFKAYEYGKLIKNKPKTSFNSDANYSSLGIINENEGYGNRELKQMMDFHNKNTYIVDMSNKNNSNVRYVNDNSHISNTNINNYEEKNKNSDDLIKLQNQREAYLLKINEIKESLINKIP